MPRNRYLLLLVALAAVTAAPLSLVAAEMPAEEAWKALPNYSPGQDIAPLLTLDREVITAMRSAETRAACAAKLAELLGKDGTTLAARQYICLQLRQVGTAAEVPLLSQLLGKPETSEMARYALQSIPGEESAAVLRAALTSSKGPSLVGVINSVAANKDAAAVGALRTLADASDQTVAKAAIGALGSIADRAAADFLVTRAEKAGNLKDPTLRVALLRCAVAGQHAKQIYTTLSQADQPGATRRAALEGLLRLKGDAAEATILGWFSSDDADRRRIAAGHLHGLSDGQLDKLLARLPDLPDADKLAVVELSVTRRGAAMLPTVMALVKSPNIELKQAGIRCLGLIGDASSIPVLVDMLATGGDVAKAAQKALARLPRKEVTGALLDALRKRPALRVPVIAALIELKCYDAIDPLVEIAASDDPAEYGPALDGLRGIADPDETDIPRLVRLLLRSKSGKHRDEVEKTILIVCGKLAATADRSELVLASLEKEAPSDAPKYLPVLGRLGGAKALKKIEASLGSPDTSVQEAAVRALCNWPNADVADKLLELARTSENREFRRWALRAYIRVVSLRSERPEAETLAMLQNAFKLADRAEEKRWSSNGRRRCERWSPSPGLPVFWTIRNYPRPRVDRSSSWPITASSATRT